jgi:3-oxoacyl-[acyl-carrier protein] reductase
MLQDLKDKSAFVMGGSNGIGAATVRGLADAGARVAVGYCNGKQRAEALVSSLHGEGHFIVQIDAGNSESVSAAVKDISSEFSALDILVNSGGMTHHIPHDNLDALTDEIFDDIMRVNARGVYSTIRGCLNLLKASGDAVVINISSVAGELGLGSNVAYCASKGAVDTMTRSLARALAPNIRILAVSPGVVDTEFIPGVNMDALREYAKREALGKIVSPEDVADTVLACVTHLRLSTGSNIPVDAGRILHKP